jgi:hypothetical protein
MSETNWKNWKKLRAHIARQPDENVRMETILFINKDQETAAQARQPKCGTVGCIAGHGFTLFSPNNLVLIRSDLQRGGDGLTNVDSIIDGDVAWDTTARALGLRYGEADFVFTAGWHPVKLWSSGTITKAEVLAYLDKAIAKKDVMVTI